jgi:hypothetical protein
MPMGEPYPKPDPRSPRRGRTQPKKRMGPSKPLPKKGRGGNKKAGSMEDMTKRKRYDDIMGYKREFVGTPPKKNVKRGAK